MEFLFVIAVLIMSVVVHEVAHGYAALALGDPTAKYQNRLTLNPISHLDPVGSVLVPLLGYLAGGFIIGWARPVPFNPYNLRNARWGEAIVAAAGPISNIIIATIFGLGVRFLGTSFFGTEAMGLVTFIVIINITLAIFNLIPIPPLDGSKILFAILPQALQSFKLYFERFGLVLVLVFIFVLWPAISPIVRGLFGLLTGIPI